MSVLTIYLFVMMDKIGIGLIILTGVMILGYLMSAVCMDTKDNSERRKSKRWRNIFATAFFIAGFAAIATPDTKQFAAIYLIPKVVNNENVQAMSGDAMKMLRAKFDEYLDSIDPIKEVVNAIKPKED